MKYDPTKAYNQNDATGFNARIETLTARAAFKQAYQQRR